MVAFISISIGLFITVFSLIMIKREVMKASFFKHIKTGDNVSEDIIKQVQLLEEKVDEMNQSFYDISSDLEGKYSVQEKEMEIIDQKINDLTTLTKDLSQMLNFQGKEIASIREPQAVKQPEKKSIPPSEDIKEEIIRLKALGYDEQAIARKLNKGVREIKMIMNFIK